MKEYVVGRMAALGDAGQGFYIFECDKTSHSTTQHSWHVLDILVAPENMNEKMIYHETWNFSGDAHTIKCANKKKLIENLFLYYEELMK